MMTPREAARRATSWLFDACFPFWAARGPDPRGGFRERLTLDGAPVDDEVGRVRVQARQTYVFAEAASMGWRPADAAALVRRGVETMLVTCRRPDLLFGRTVRPGAGLADPTPDLYDNAFCLMALGCAARALGEPSLLDEADRTLDALDRLMAHPAGGFVEALPPTAVRRQNPHMHLFEAMLALHEADAARRYLDRADALAKLLADRFIDRRSGALLEFFQDDWSPHRGAEGEVVEPGHLFEWCWLLGAYCRARGDALRPLQRRLYDVALRFLDARGTVPQSADIRGRIVDASRRAWPQTEALKAHCAAHGRGDGDGLARAALTLDSLFADHLDAAPQGGWLDHVAPDGAPRARDMPASTGYHVVLALSEFVRTAGADSRVWGGA